MPIGTIKGFRHGKGRGFGFGFLVPEGKVGASEPDVFLHHSALPKGYIAKDGDRVQYEIVPGLNGKTQAGHIQVLT